MGLSMSLVGQKPKDTRDLVYRVKCRCKQGVTCPVEPRYSDTTYVPRHQSAQGTVYIPPYAYNVNSGRYDNEVTNFQTFGAENVTTGWTPQHNVPDSGSGLLYDSSQAKPGRDGRNMPYGFNMRQMYKSGARLN